MIDLSALSYTGAGLVNTKESARSVLDCLENIYRLSRKGLKEEAVLKKLQQASSFTPKLFALTARKGKYFSYLNERITPKQVYCSVVEDDFSTYENRFAKLILRKFKEEISLAYSDYRRQSSLRSVIQSGISYSSFGTINNLNSYLSSCRLEGELEDMDLYELFLLKQEADALDATFFFSSIEPLLEEDVHATNALNYDPIYGMLYRAYHRSMAEHFDSKVMREILSSFVGNHEFKFGGSQSWRQGDFEIDVDSRMSNMALVKITNAFDGFHREYSVSTLPSFFYPRFVLGSDDGRNTLISLFKAEDYAAPLKLLLTTIPETKRFCPICGEPMFDDRCSECGLHIHAYQKDGTKYAWLLDLPYFGMKEGKDNE